MFVTLKPVPTVCVQWFFYAAIAQCECCSRCQIHLRKRISVYKWSLSPAINSNIFVRKTELIACRLCQTEAHKFIINEITATTTKMLALSQYFHYQAFALFDALSCYLSFSEFSIFCFSQCAYVFQHNVTNIHYLRKLKKETKRNFYETRDIQIELNFDNEIISALFLIYFSYKLFMIF